MRTLIMTCICALLLSACAPGRYGWVWTQKGMGEKERAAAVAECRRLTRQEAPIPWIAYPSGAEFYEEREGEFNRCMEQRGWRAERP